MLRWLSEIGSNEKGFLIDTDAPPPLIVPPPPVVGIERITRRRATREEPEEADEEEPLTLKWWYAYQNNPMGRTDYFPDKGVGEYVLFEAYSKEDADSRFQSSVRETSSCECSCCGPRWDWELEGEGTAEPTIYGKPLEEYLNDLYKSNSKVFLHYWDGRIEEIVAMRENK